MSLPLVLVVLRPLNLIAILRFLLKVLACRRMRLGSDPTVAQLESHVLPQLVRH
jgi:hypothetical protein